MGAKELSQQSFPIWPCESSSCSLIVRDLTRLFIVRVILSAELRPLYFHLQRIDFSLARYI